MNSKTHFKHIHIRSLVVQAIRDFFHHNNFLEVETPIRCPSVIPEAQIDPVTSEGWFLQASPELCMKRALSKGFDRIFQICKCFRKNERGCHHLPELTMLEWYAKDNTYLDLMDQCEALVKFIAQRVKLDGKLHYQGKIIDLDQTWQRITVSEAFRLYSDISLTEALKLNRFDEIISFRIEPHLGNLRPAFLYDYPAPLASLAKLLPKNHAYAERVEFYIAGIELANGFTELTDAGEQNQRFLKENMIRLAQGKALLPLPDKFLKDLETMPAAAGIALGVDRLVMLFCNATSIDEVVLFTPEAL
ncbi:MAG: EF-P lysine aminoacylase GenX [Desulfobacterales bacterium RIFOXYA12_FULL_46_15]|nr:MAG: EF-P lysine aminoacylase GenX [Desulfobacula sp. GWF2_41_7]OGR23932.1 MAG: EF-P lysine aminoacylase GenX [Desulfobacterales bacterium RIFOXYA12_FULL_46_15]